MHSVDSLSSDGNLPFEPKENIKSTWKKAKSCLSMVPSSVALVACVLGVVALNILQYHYFSIVLAVGTLGSGYAVYQSYRVRQLEGFKENNIQLRRSLKTLKKEIAVFQKENLTLTQETDKLRKTVSRLETTVVSLKKINKERSENIESLKSLTEEQKEIIANFEKGIEKYVKQLGILEKAFRELQESIDKDHNTFSSKLKEFKVNLSGLRDTSSSIETTCSEFSSKVDEQCKQLSQVAAVAEKLCETIEIWKNPKRIQESLNALDKIRDQTLEMGKQMVKFETQSNFAKQQAKEFKKEVEELRHVKSELSQALELLKQEIKEIGHVVENKRIVLDGVRKLVAEIKELPKDRPLPDEIQKLLEILIN